MSSNKYKYKLFIVKKHFNIYIKHLKTSENKKKELRYRLIPKC